MLSDEDITSVKQPCAVRWLSLHYAVESMKSNWPALVMALNEEAVGGNAQAKDILGQIQPYSFIALTHTLFDVLPVMTKLNVVFQKDNVNMATINQSQLFKMGRFPEDSLDLLNRYDVLLNPSHIPHGTSGKLKQI